MSNNIGRRGRGGTASEVDRPGDLALASIASASEDVAAALAFVKEHPDAGKSPILPSVKRDSGIHLDRPGLQIAINNLNAALDALSQISTGDLGGFRAKANNDITAAINDIIAADRASRRDPGPSETAATPPATSPEVQTNNLPIN